MTKCDCSDDPRNGCGECEEAGRLGICEGCDTGCYCHRELDRKRQKDYDHFIDSIEGKLMHCDGGRTGPGMSETKRWMLFVAGMAVVWMMVFAVFVALRVIP